MYLQLIVPPNILNALDPLIHQPTSQRTPLSSRSSSHSSNSIDNNIDQNDFEDDPNYQIKLKLIEFFIVALDKLQIQTQSLRNNNFKNREHRASKNVWLGLSAKASKIINYSFVV